MEEKKSVDSEVKKSKTLTEARLLRLFEGFMRRIICCLIFGITSYTLTYAQYTIDTTSYFIEDNITHTKIDWSVYIGWGDTLDHSRSLVMDSIDEQDYWRYKRIHPNPLRIDSSLVSFTDSSFTIHTGNKNLTYTTLIQDNTPWAEYNGWLKELQLHVVTSIDGKNEIGTLLLVDGKSGKVFYLESGWDGPCAPPLLSPDGKTLLTYANTNYESDQSLILLHRVRRRDKFYRLELIQSETIPGKLIEDAVWMDEDRFAIGFSEVRDPEDSNRVLVENYYVKVALVRIVAEPSE